MKFTPKQYAEALHQAIFESKPGDKNRILDNFIKVLKDNDDLRVVDEIEKEFYEYDRRLKGIKTAEVTSARELAGADEQQIIRELNEFVSGRVELKKKVDAGLIGGVVVRIGDELIDGSVKKNLSDLKSELIK